MKRRHATVSDLLLGLVTLGTRGEVRGGGQENAWICSRLTMSTIFWAMIHPI